MGWRGCFDNMGFGGGVENWVFEEESDFGVGEVEKMDFERVFEGENLDSGVLGIVG